MPTLMPTLMPTRNPTPAHLGVCTGSPEWTTRIGNMQYLFVATPMTADDAQQYCQEQGTSDRQGKGGVGSRLALPRCSIVFSRGGRATTTLYGRA